MIKNIFRDKILRSLILIQLIQLVIYPVILVIKYPFIPSQIPLFYSRPRGVDQLGDSRSLLIIPLFSLLILIIHIFLSSKYYRTEKLASYFIGIISLTSNTLIFITVLRIIFLIS
ncbi:hypothetical protein A3D77_05365 [Candidatus Gottesmanbacteria bacterium RIFCSPHIGHO2_02_FULL_39_11]|uniref:DUF1648 domain-containing protein n=1 Tax=Candidatus Gottesmanbacteria bacterium RIFCSPHIGHO2_02_FULL_39_11 TaxID=1798382 RepID=A0A1F5ZLR2_9BACT|nr:MAG: hypothetical protein A3D77_05365 [Candidatus Gottesmanbacteria bacterium RIFCSPHIGHO2_02_FULL_39_11]